MECSSDAFHPSSHGFELKEIILWDFNDLCLVCLHGRTEAQEEIPRKQQRKPFRVQLSSLGRNVCEPREVGVSKNLDTDL